MKLINTLQNSLEVSGANGTLVEHMVMWSTNEITMITQCQTDTLTKQTVKSVNHQHQ